MQTGEYVAAFNPQDWGNPQDRIVYAHLPGEKEAWEANEQWIAAELERQHKDLAD